MGTARRASDGSDSLPREFAKPAVARIAVMAVVPDHGDWKIWKRYRGGDEPFGSRILRARAPTRWLRNSMAPTDARSRPDRACHTCGRIPCAHSLAPDLPSVRFLSNDSELTVTRDGASFALEMPALRPRTIEPPAPLIRGLGREPKAVLMAPNMSIIAALELPAVIVTAPAADDVDFASRFFPPANGVPEDPMSGVAHLCLAPYWSERLGKRKMVGRQLSARGGVVRCEDLGSCVRLGGNAAMFLDGRITI